MPVLKYMIKRIFFWGLVVSLVAMVVYLLFPDLILRLLTNDAHIITATKGYLFWTLLIPIAGFAAFLWDGIFIGATASVEMRNAMILSTIIFFGSYFLMTPVWGNNGLWFSFILYLATRGITLTFMARKAFKQA
jgi:MATE family multidrug resistance protein